MKKMITGVVVIMMVVATLATTRAYAQADTSTVHIHRTRTGVMPNPCNGEPVQLTLELDILIHTTVSDTGGRHRHTTSNLSGTGLGLVTGADYVLSSVATANTNLAGAINQTLWQDAVLVGKGDVPNFLFQEIEHITINDNLEVTVDFEKPFTKCLG
jgi:hypothetical protein